MRSRPTTLFALAAVALAAPGSAAAGPVLDYRYAGVVAEVYDPFGVFGGVAVGAPVGRSIRLAAPVPPKFGDGFLAFYDAPVPGGGNRMTAAVGPLDLRASADLFVSVYNPAQLGLAEVDFQFNDADRSALPTAGLPAGSQLANLLGFVGLISTDLSTSPYPDLPAVLLPLSGYDPSATIGILSVDVFDANGRYVDSPYIAFGLTGLTAVPEPASLTLLAAGGLGLLGHARRRSTGGTARP